MNLLRSIGLTSVLLLAATPALAHHKSSMQGMDMSGTSMPGMDMKNMMGTHTMPATVTAVDTKTGLLDVTSEGMALRVHFPPTALVNVRAGDKITLHLGFMKP
jgi:hypothetical protein